MTKPTLAALGSLAVVALVAPGCSKKVCPEGPLPPSFRSVSGVVGPGVRVCADERRGPHEFYVCVVDTSEMDSVRYESAEKKLLHHMVTADGWSPDSLLKGVVMKTMNGRTVRASVSEMMRLGPTCAAISFNPWPPDAR